MAKPKGFSTMCWLGIILNGLALAFCLIVVAYQIAYIFASIPSLVALGLFESDTATAIIFPRIFINGFQLFFLCRILFPRENKIRGLMITFAADILVTFLEALASPANYLPNAIGIILVFALYAIPALYFCRKPVYEYLDH